MKMTLYHGTDLSAAKNIQEHEFTSKLSPNHWLGNGIYFYFDIYLAKWWTSKPTNKFGSDIVNPALVKVDVEIPQQHVMDLRCFNTYRKIAREFERLYEGLYMGYDLYNASLERFRCMFFDWIKLNHPNIWMIIGDFYSISQPYTSKLSKEFFNSTKILYGETQICLNCKHQHIIKSKEVIKL